MWTDTHCHLDAAEFGGKGREIAAEAARLGVSKIVIPSVDRHNFRLTAELAHACPNCAYALGIHPMYVVDSRESDLLLLEELLEKGLSDPKLVAIGEIGLDFFIPELAEPVLREKQEFFLAEQLKMAKRFSLPVLLHTRRSVDTVLKQLRRYHIRSGIAHAFSGSMQQAEAFIRQGFKLSFCGTATYERAVQKRQQAAELPIESIVIETDAPDLPPAWKKKKENSPVELPEIGRMIADLRKMDLAEFAETTSRNALAAIPRLADAF